MSKLFLIDALSHKLNEDFIYGEVALEYCTSNLNIPYEKIEYVDCNYQGLKIMLQDINNKDEKQNWFEQLNALAS